MIYTGIGSRSTPQVVLDLMTEIGMYFGKAGIILRSGGALGADSAFEQGCDAVKGPKQIFFPSRIFAGRDASTVRNSFVLGEPSQSNLHIFRKAKEVWESRPQLCEWSRLKTFTKILMARNVQQVLGPNADIPTQLIICWTEDGEAIGGTGQAMCLARMINEDKSIDYVIPIINLQKTSHRDIMKNVLGGDNPIGLIKFAQNSLSEALKKGLYKEKP